MVLSIYVGSQLPTTGILGFFLIIGFVLIAEWSEKFLLSRAGRLRGPTDKEADKLGCIINQEPIISELSIKIFESNDKNTHTLAAPVGGPWQREFVLGSQFVSRDDHIIRAIIAIQESRVENRFYQKRLVAALLRLEALFLAIIYFLPLVSPYPDPQLAVGVAIVLTIWLLGIEYWIRSQIYEIDQHAAAKYDTDLIQKGLLEYADQAGISRSRSRISEFFNLSPSIDDRVENLQSQ